MHLLALGLFLIAGLESSLACASAKAVSETCPAGFLRGKHLSSHLVQLTGTENPGGFFPEGVTGLADPAPPFTASDSSVEIYGSAPFYLKYSSRDDFEKGGCYEKLPLDLRGPSLQPYGHLSGGPWDLRKFRILHRGAGPEEVLVGGAMSARAGEISPVWPDDNITRRIYFFRRSAHGSWVRDQKPIIGQATESWIGHSYGGNFLQQDANDPSTLDPENGKPLFFFFEQVFDDSGNLPFKTGLFSAKVDSSLRTTTPVQTIFDLGHPAYPSTRRTHGGFLAEGPRPFAWHTQGRIIYLLGFSSGDYFSDSYRSNYAWSDHLAGPYHVVLQNEGRDLLDLGAGVKKKFSLTMVGRPVFFVNPQGKLEMMFHAAQAPVTGKAPVRSLFKVPVRSYFAEDGTPQLQIDD